MSGWVWGVEGGSWTVFRLLKGNWVRRRLLLVRKESRGSRVSGFVYATAVSSCDIHEGHVWILFAILSEQAPGNVEDVV